jgi:hypothetical protein
VGGDLVSRSLIREKMITQWRYIEDPEIVIAKVWLDQDHGFAIAYDANGNLISGKQGLWITFTDYLLRRIGSEAGKHILYDEFPPRVKPVLRKEKPAPTEYKKEIPPTLEELKEQEKDLKRYSEPFPCVYFLIHNGETVYIGKTTRALQSRIIDHRKDSEKVFNEIY